MADVMTGYNHAPRYLTSNKPFDSAGNDYDEDTQVIFDFLMSLPGSPLVTPKTSDILIFPLTGACSATN